MPNTVGKIPDFTDDSPSGVEEVKQATVEETVETEKETPTEPPAEEQPTDASVSTQESAQSKDQAAETVQKPVDTREQLGLESERERLLREIAELRRVRREIRLEQKEEPKQAEPIIVAKDDDLADIDPTSVTIVQKVLEKELRKYGHVTREEMERARYESVKQEKLDQFLEKFPEYKPENDPQNSNWNLLNEQLNRYYKAPKDPRDFGDLLEHAHRNIIRASPVKRDTAMQHRVAVAGLGSGGSQRSSPKGKFSDFQRQVYLNGGWSEKDIQEMERDM